MFHNGVVFELRVQRYINSEQCVPFNNKKNSPFFLCSGGCRVVVGRWSRDGTVVRTVYGQYKQPKDALRVSACLALIFCNYSPLITKSSGKKPRKVDSIERMVTGMQCRGNGHTRAGDYIALEYEERNATPALRPSGRGGAVG